jgi:aminodeoxyfutalosine deaminase
MKRFSAQYVITNTTPPLKRAIITTEDDGTIISIEDTGGRLKEEYSIEFHNGIIIPGFVNCHCHLELSHMHGIIDEGTGLGGFIEQVRGGRDNNRERVAQMVLSADSSMYKEGIVL